jgi:hypothetical protein
MKVKMGTEEPDKCIFCRTELEEYGYEYFEENGERAKNPIEEYDTLDICKDCVRKIKQILGVK